MDTDKEKTSEAAEQETPVETAPKEETETTAAAPEEKAETPVETAPKEETVTAAAEEAPKAEAKEEASAEKVEAKVEAKAEAASSGASDSKAGAGVKVRESRVEQARRRVGETRDEDSGPELTEKVVFINRCAKVVKGGRRFSFSALVVCGDRGGRVGYGFGKAGEVAECIRKASDSSKRSMMSVCLKENTIPHEVVGQHGGGRVLLRPASPGTGIIAGGSVRAVVEAAGIKDILAKSLGSNNHANVVKATLDALGSLRSRDEILSLRGKKTADKKAI